MSVCACVRACVCVCRGLVVLHLRLSAGKVGVGGWGVVEENQTPFSTWASPSLLRVCFMITDAERSQSLYNSHMDSLSSTKHKNPSLSNWALTSVSEMGN